MTYVLSYFNTFQMLEQHTAKRDRVRQILIIPMIRWRNINLTTSREDIFI